MSNDRTQQILTAVDYLIHTHDDWESDDTAPMVPTEALADALEDCFLIVNRGDIPQQCREIHTALGRLEFEWEEYKAGRKMQRNGRPQESLWAAYRELLEARRGAIEPVPRTIESVRNLRKQGVSDLQIAKMYGTSRPGEFDRVWTGPFFDSRGRVNHRLIDQQEAFENGDKTADRIIPEGWIHPDEQSRVEEERKEMEKKLSRMTESQRHRDDTPTPKDPSTIEEHLLEGAYAAQVAKAHGVSIEEVMQVANQLGIKPNEPNSPKPWDQQEAEEKVRLRKEAEEMILLIYSESQEQGEEPSAKEIAEQANSELGRTDITHQKVGMVLREAREAVAVE